MFGQSSVSEKQVSHIVYTNLTLKRYLISTTIKRTVCQFVRQLSKAVAKKALKHGNRRIDKKRVS